MGKALGGTRPGAQIWARRDQRSSVSTSTQVAGSGGGEPAIDRMRRSGGIAGVIGQQEGDQAGNILRGAMAPDLPPAEWARDYDSLDHERDDAFHSKSTSRKRSSASCVKLRSCWRRGRRLPKRVCG